MSLLSLRRPSSPWGCPDDLPDPNTARARPHKRPEGDGESSEGGRYRIWLLLGLVARHRRGDHSSIGEGEKQNQEKKSRRGNHRTTEKGGRGRTGPPRGKQIGRADLTASTPPLPSEGRVLSARQSEQALPLTLMLSNVSMMLAAQGGAKALVLHDSAHVRNFEVVAEIVVATVRGEGRSAGLLRSGHARSSALCLRRGVDVADVDVAARAALLLLL